MQNQKITKIIGIIVLLVVIFIVSSSAGIVAVPQGLQRIYYGTFYNLSTPENGTSSFDKVHEATKVKVQGPNGKTYLTYKYTEEHRAVITADSARCQSCHGSMLQKENGKPVNPIHVKMLTASMLRFSCTDCHKKVDTGKRTPTGPTYRVDRSLCPKCHEPSGASATAEASQGNSFAPGGGAPALPNLMSRHGSSEKPQVAKDWIRKHPRIAMSIGIDKCGQCHIKGSELDFCRECHLRGGFRPSSHRAVYKAKINEIFPEEKKTDVVETNWRGYHFVLARKGLEKLGVKVDSPRNLPLDKVQKLPCAACHQVTDWCTRCHIKHAPDWLNPNTGHPLKVYKFGRSYCNRCHDKLGSKCQSCHTFAGRLQ